jgi:hypothetical protein
MQLWLKAKSQEPRAKSHNLQFLEAASSSGMMRREKK